MTKREQYQKLIDSKGDKTIELVALSFKDTEDKVEQLIQDVEEIKSIVPEPGYTPIKGKDYYTEEEQNQLIKYVQDRIKIPKDGKDGSDGKDGKSGNDGKDAVIDYKKIIKDILKEIPKPTKEKPLDIEELTKQIQDKLPRVNYREEIGKILETPGFRMLLHGGGLSDAPIDGKKYGRKDGLWDEITSTGGGQVNTVSAGTGISVNSTDPANPVVSNTAPDQTVSISAGTHITSITGTYPNFTINAETQSGGDMVLASVQTNSGAKTFLDGTFLLRNVADTFTGQFSNTNLANRTYTLKDADGTLAFTTDIPSVGSWGALNYPTWASGTPFVKMTAAGTFALDTTSYVSGTPWRSEGYLTSLTGAVLTDQTTPQTIGDTTNRLAKLWATDITCSNTITGSVNGNAGTVTNGVYTTSQVTALSATAVGDKGKYLHSNSSTGALEWSAISGGGDVLGPATNTDGYIPLWSGANSKTLADGIANSSSNWNTAYGWGNHATAGYLTSVTAHNLLSATHGDTLTDTVVRGDVMVGNGTPKWSRLALGANRKVLMSDGTDIGWSAGALGSAAYAATGDFATAAQGTLADNAMPIAGGTFTGDVTFADSHNLIFNTTNGTQIGTGGTQKIGFWGVTPVVRPSAFTQTYSTATHTVANLTAAALTDNTGGTANTTLESIGTTYSQSAVRNNFADLAAMVNKNTADHVVLIRVVTAIIDDLQSMGILQ